MRKTIPPGVLIAILLAATSCRSIESGTDDDPLTPSADGSILADWNELVLEVAESEDRFLTLKGLRTAAMMHIAAHDALNAVKPVYDSYTDLNPRPDAAPAVVAVQAMFVVASDQYPDARAQYEALRERHLREHSECAADDDDLALGTAAANEVLTLKKGDGWDGEAEYLWQPMAPGVYAEFNKHSGTPQGFVFGAGWAEAKPFALESPAQFRSPPPPKISSDEYTKAFKEVKNVGATKSDTRTADQTHLAMWWKDFVENSHKRLARQLVREDKLGMWQTARMFALLNMSIYDAYINVFDNKFHYNHWRPYTAIRWASNDGNPDTTEDPDWNNLHEHTYAFPSYPSAHGTASAAAMTVLADTFGPSREITMTTRRIDKAGPLSDKIPIEPVTRSFESFQAAAVECSNSRVYLGIHFRYDSTEGTLLGRRVGDYVVGNQLCESKD
jgi:hypothetical protein